LAPVQKTFDPQNKTLLLGVDKFDIDISGIEDVANKNGFILKKSFI
jgi:hypothetical protein